MLRPIKIVFEGASRHIRFDSIRNALSTFMPPSHKWAPQIHHSFDDQNSILSFTKRSRDTYIDYLPILNSPEISIYDYNALLKGSATPCAMFELPLLIKSAMQTEESNIDGQALNIANVDLRSSQLVRNRNDSQTLGQIVKSGACGFSGMAKFLSECISNMSYQGLLNPMIVIPYSDPRIGASRGHNSEGLLMVDIIDKSKGLRALLAGKNQITINSSYKAQMLFPNKGLSLWDSTAGMPCSGPAVIVPQEELLELAKRLHEVQMQPNNKQRNILISSNAKRRESIATTLETSPQLKVNGPVRSKHALGIE